MQQHQHQFSTQLITTNFEKTNTTNFLSTPIQPTLSTHNTNTQQHYQNNATNTQQNHQQHPATTQQG